MKRLLPLALVAALTTSCMGSFMLTRTLYGFNQRLTGSQVVNHLVFWALVFVLPVYELALLGDAFILNVIEFWTGNKFMASNIERLDDGSIRVARGDEVFIARPVSDRRVEVSSGDRFIGAGELDDDGSLVISNADGPVASVSREVLAAAAPALPGGVQVR